MTDQVLFSAATAAFAVKNTVPWSFAEVTGTYAELMAAGAYIPVVSSANTTIAKITLTGPNAAVPIADAIVLAGSTGAVSGGFNVASGATFEVTGTLSAIVSAGAGVVGKTTKVTLSDLTVTITDAESLVALNTSATYVGLNIVGAAVDIVTAARETAHAVIFQKATTTKISADVELNVADAGTLLLCAATQDASGYTALRNSFHITVVDTATNILASSLVLAGVDKFKATTATAAEATTLAGLISSSFAIGAGGLVVIDSAANLTNSANAAGVAAATTKRLSGVNELLAANVTTLGAVTRDPGTTIIVADTWAQIKSNATAVEALALADTNAAGESKFLSIELTGDDALTLSAAQYATLDDTLDHVVEVSGFTVTVADATAAGLVTAHDNNGLRNVVSVDASTASTTITIDLSDQAEGFTVTGGSGANTILGSVASNTIIGGGLADIITGGAAADTISGGGGADVIVAGNGADSISGGDGADDITGGAGADLIFGDAGDDLIKEFVAADTVDGGDGTDSLVLTATSAFLNAATNSQLVNVETVTAYNAAAAVTIDLSKQTEAFTITGASGQINTITGSSGANAITGGSVADVITGGVGADVITGAAGADKILAGAGNDTINDFAGADTVDGGLGSDTLLLTATQGSLTTAVDTQLVNVETVSAIGVSANITIDVHLQTEALTILGTVTGTNVNTIIGSVGANNITGGGGADVITGGAAADKIYAGAGADTINGFVGADTIDGGAGTTDTLVLTATSATLNTAVDAQLLGVETVTASAATAAVIINLSKQTESAGFTIAGATGNYINTITGSAGADGITGGSGADLFNGYIGDDTINGADGTDTLVLTGSITTSNTNRLVSVENVSASTLTTAVVIDLRNESEVETITGGGGADTIYGGSGNDKISGGAGNDTIMDLIGTDIIDGGVGTDTLLLTGANSLASALDTQITTVEVISAIGVSANITIDVHLQTEALTILGTVTGTNVNTIIGSVGANNITGGGGADVITGGAAADKIYAGAGADTINGFVGADTIDGGAETDSLVLTATSATLSALS